MRKTRNPPSSHHLFKKWFGDSKIVDEKGDPIVVYHGTGSGFDFDTFEYGFFLDEEDNIANDFSFDYNAFIGPHFTADPKIASNFAEGKMEWNYMSKKYKSRVIPVYLKIENPLFFDDESRMRDVILHHGRDSRSLISLIEQEYDLDISDEDWEKELDKILDRKEEIHSLISTLDNLDFRADIFTEIADGAKHFFEKAGHDGIIYENQGEGGGYSYIPFSNDQIWWLLKSDIPDIE